MKKKLKTEEGTTISYMPSFWRLTCDLLSKFVFHNDDPELVNETYHLSQTPSGTVHIAQLKQSQKRQKKMLIKRPAYRSRFILSFPATLPINKSFGLLSHTHQKKKKLRSGRRLASGSLPSVPHTRRHGWHDFSDVTRVWYCWSLMLVYRTCACFAVRREERGRRQGYSCFLLKL